MLVLYRLLSFYDALPYNDTYRSPTSIILRNLRQIPELSLEKLAELCFVSPTTINRLTRKLGCKGYADFKRDIRDSLSDYDSNLCNMSNDGTSYLSTPEKTVHELFDALLNLTINLPVHTLDQVCNAMRKSRKISFYADIRDCSIPLYARLLQLHLVLDGKETSFLHDPKNQLDDINNLDDDCLVIIPCAKYIPSYKEASSAIQQAHKKGAVIVAIAEKGSPIISLVNYPLEYAQPQSGLDRDLVDWILTMLVIRYCQTRDGQLHLSD